MKKLFSFIIIAALIVCIIQLVPKITEYFFPFGYNTAVEKAAEKWGVDRALVYAVIKAESNFDAQTQSPRGAKGLMQLLDSTAEWCAGEMGLESYDLSDPEDNINIGVYYLSYLLDYYKGNEKTALSAYNAGHGNVDGWISGGEYSKDGETLDTIPFSETEKYIKKIEFYKKVYAWRLAS